METLVLQTDFREIKELLYKIVYLSYPRWMDIKTVSIYTSLSKNSLMKLLYNGNIRAKKLDGKWLFDRESIDKFMQEDDIYANIRKLELTSSSSPNQKKISNL